MLQLHGIFLSDMKKQVSTKQLLQALLQNYIDTTNLRNIYKGDGSDLITVDEAIEFVNGLKEEASPEQVEFECQLDTMMEEFRNVFPPSMKKSKHASSWFDRMHNIWKKHVQPELTEKYSNL